MQVPVQQIHPIPPLYDSESRVLILGSFPSVKSREGRFFYHHPQNRFWKVLSAVLEEPLPQSVEEKAAMLHRLHIALWDVIGRCEIAGSQDSSISAVVPNDLGEIFSAAPIRAVYLNGATAGRYYRRAGRDWGVPAAILPSTSPANAAWTLPRLVEAWGVIRSDLG